VCVRLGCGLCVCVCIGDHVSVCTHTIHNRAFAVLKKWFVFFWGLGVPSPEHFCVWYDWFMCVTWFIRVTWFMCVTWFIRVVDLMHTTQCVPLMEETRLQIFASLEILRCSCYIFWHLTHIGADSFDITWINHVMSNIRISRSYDVLVTSFEWRGLRWHTWKPVWNFTTAQNSLKFSRESPYISNTFCRKSQTIQTGFHVSKRSPRHSKECPSKPDKSGDPNISSLISFVSGVWHDMIDSCNVEAISTYMCDMTHSHVWHDAFMLAAGLIHVCSYMCAPQSHTCVWTLASILSASTYVIWLLHIVPWLIQMGAMTHSNGCHDSFKWLPWLIHMGAMTHSYGCHDSFMCASQLQYH